VQPMMRTIRKRYGRKNDTGTAKAIVLFGFVVMVVGVVRTVAEAL